MKSVLTAEKNFQDEWLGDPHLNRLGLHPLRIALSDVCLALRRSRLPRPETELKRAFLRDGIVLVPDFLPAERFAALRGEVNERLEQLRAEHPYPSATKIGYGPKQRFPGGYDHHDGGTLNRYVPINRSTPHTRALSRHPRLTRLASFAAGFAYRPSRCQLIETIHARDSRNPDVQAETHKDTFHSTVKFWYFVEDCTLEQGPFAYSKGSHRMGLSRYRWEYDRAVQASSGGSRRGSFRASDAELRAMGYEPPTPVPVAGNTLVLADTRGFHRRTPGLPGARRVAVHAVLRWNPFQLSAVPGS